MSDATLVNALRRMGYSKDELVAHSFRAMFSTIAHEKSPFSHDVIEVQLGHAVGNKIAQAYNRAKYLDERVKLMQWWSDFLDGVKKDD
jgi:integrase